MLVKFASTHIISSCCPSFSHNLVCPVKPTPICQCLPQPTRGSKKNSPLGRDPVGADARKLNPTCDESLRIKSYPRTISSAARPLNFCAPQIFPYLSCSTSPKGNRPFIACVNEL